VYTQLTEFSEVVHSTTDGRLSNAKTSMAFLGDAYRGLVEENSAEVFPNVTLPHFGQHAAPIQELVHPLLVAMAPLVTTEELQGWEQYAIENQGWISEDLELAGVNVTADRPGSIHETVYSWDDEVDDIPLSGMYAPLWQMSPAPEDAFESPIMLDVLSIPWLLPTIEQVITGRYPVYSSVHDCATIFTPNNATKEDRRLESEDFEHEEDKDADHAASQPCSVIVEPIFENFNDDDAPVVALSLAVVSWTQVFEDILEDEAAGTIIVLQESCDSTSYTFFVTDDGISYGGPNVTLEEGYDDLHHVEQSSANVHQSSAESSGGAASASEDRRLESEDGEEPAAEDSEQYKCQFYIAVNGGSEYVANWQQEEPLQYSLIVVFIFLATGFAFLVYDMVVERRNKKVESIAKRSADLVSSLFPANVRERIMEENQKKNAKASNKISPFLADDDDDAKKSDDSVIADFYPATTILFADIAGFTAWSSVREPKQVSTAFFILEALTSSELTTLFLFRSLPLKVFTLLETLYGAL
jgi:hypothetical protein